MIVLRRNLGWCVVIGGRMYPIDDFQRGQLKKPSIKIQAKAAFALLQQENHPDFHAGTTLLLMKDVHLNWF